MKYFKDELSIQVECIRCRVNTFRQNNGKVIKELTRFKDGVQQLKRKRKGRRNG